MTRLKDFVAAHPLTDHLPAILVIGAWFVFLAEIVVVPESTRPTLYAGVATISGLAMAASTFVCTMTYQSANILMSRVVKTHARDLSRNWISIIGSNLVTAVVPLVALAFDNSFHAAASAVTVYCLALLLARSARAIWWLQYTLFMQEKSFEVPEKAKVQLRADLRTR